VQAQFAIHLDDADIADIGRVLDLLIGLDPQGPRSAADAAD
jgi:hypothetical protein